MSKKVLKQLASGKITVSEAYDILYRPKPRKANFLKMKMSIKENKAVSALINTLFFFPVPISFGKYFIKKALVKNNLPASLYEEVIHSIGGTSIKVESKEANIKIYIF